MWSRTLWRNVKMLHQIRREKGNMTYSIKGLKAELYLSVYLLYDFVLLAS